MNVCYYFLNLLQDYKCENNAILTSLVICKHAVYTEEGKILMNNLFDLNGYNGEQLVSKFPSKG